MTKHTIRIALAAGALALFAPSARAGAGSQVHEVTVTASTQTATGTPYWARRSNDTTQKISCQANFEVGSGDPLVYCSATNRYGASLYCYAYDANVGQAVLGMDQHSFITFRCDGTSLLSLSVTKNSNSLP